MYSLFVLFSSLQCVATFRRKSQLSKSLVDVLMDDTVLPYFMEYMQKQNATNLLNFWLTAETFGLSTINRLRINSMSRLKTSKVDSTGTGVVDTMAVMSNSGALCTNSSLDDCNTVGTSKGVVNHQQCQENDNNEFGDFTGYEPENYTSANSSASNNAGILILCDSCGHLIDALSSNTCKDICDHCGQGIASNQTSNRTSRDSCGASYKESSCFASELQNGINENSIIINQPNAKDTEGTAECVNNDAGTLKGFRSSKVTFDLTPDFEDERREFCRRRTRSIVIDAVSIYSKYISLEASHPVGLEESIRQQIESKWNIQVKNCLLVKCSLG